MKLTIEQAIEQGISAHKEGNLEAADRIYRDILQSKLSNPEVNHNLGQVALFVNKIDAALPLFEKALIGHPKMERFRISYIDALIKANLLKSAKRAIKNA